MIIDFLNCRSMSQCSYDIGSLPSAEHSTVKFLLLASFGSLILSYVALFVRFSLSLSFFAVAFFWIAQFKTPPTFPAASVWSNVIVSDMSMKLLTIEAEAITSIVTGQPQSLRSY